MNGSTDNGTHHLGTAWFTLDEARIKLVSGQVPFLDRLAEAAQ